MGTRGHVEPGLVGASGWAVPESLPVGDYPSGTGARIEGPAPQLIEKANPPKIQALCCPKCGNTHLVRSRRRNVLERIFTFLGTPYRCPQCQSYFNLRNKKKQRRG